MSIDLERGPIPLFHQIAEALRYWIATGRLKAGERLPSVRKAAEDWGVNLHTVRRAYSELAREGLVETRAPTGSWVTERGRQALRPEDPADAFISRTIEEAKHDHGLSVDELVGLIRNWPSQFYDSPVVYFIECSLAQARGHCREIEEIWRVRAVPWSLEDSDEGLPESDLIATYFHYSEIKARWPDRMDQVHFVPIRPDASLADRIPHEGRGPSTLYMCEFDHAKAIHIASDLRSMMPEHFQIETRLVAQADEVLAWDDPSPILLSPRLWGALTPEQRTDPRVFEVNYIIDSDSIEALGRHFNFTTQKRTKT